VVKHDYYQLLGVSRSASEDALRRAFRLRILESHPDVHPNNALANQTTRRLVEAYKVLGNPLARRVYDLAITPVEEHSSASYDTCLPEPAPWLSLRLLTAVVMLAVMAFVAVSVVRAVFAESGPVYRPSLVAFEGMRPSGRIESARGIPVMVEPSTSDPVAWYHSQEYQLSLAGEWPAMQLRASYAEAARRAKLRGDYAAERFYGSIPTAYSDEAVFM